MLFSGGKERSHAASAAAAGRMASTTMVPAVADLPVYGPPVKPTAFDMLKNTEMGDAAGFDGDVWDGCSGAAVGFLKGGVTEVVQGVKRLVSSVGRPAEAKQVSEAAPLVAVPQVVETGASFFSKVADKSWDFLTAYPKQAFAVAAGTALVGWCYLAFTSEPVDVASDIGVGSAMGATAAAWGAAMGWMTGLQAPALSGWPGFAYCTLWASVGRAVFQKFELDEMLGHLIQLALDDIIVPTSPGF